MKSKCAFAEIAGVWLPNKGAELMAHTVIAELSHRIPELCFWSKPQGSGAVRAVIGMPTLQLYPKLRAVRWFREVVSCPTCEERVMIDISGFAYGDHWGVQKARNRAGKAARFGRAVYLLPQAFGPFEGPALRKEMRYILHEARMVAARDKISLQHLCELDGSTRVALLPDITVSLDVSARQPKLPNRRYGCLVLNQKSIDGGAIDKADLIDLYTNVAELFRGLGLEPVVVLHEPQADRAISQELATVSGLQLIHHEDARDTKRFLLEAECIVTGRFHGLVSGLSGGVPSFAISWSHKYQELLRDYGCEDAFYGAQNLGRRADKEAFLAKIKSLLSDDAQKSKYRTKLEAVADDQKSQLATYWDALAADIRHVLHS